MDTTDEKKLRNNSTNGYADRKVKQLWKDKHDSNRGRQDYKNPKDMNVVDKCNSRFKCINPYLVLLSDKLLHTLGKSLAYMILSKAIDHKHHAEVRKASIKTPPKSIILQEFSLLLVLLKSLLIHPNVLNLRRRLNEK